MGVTVPHDDEHAARSHATATSPSLLKSSISGLAGGVGGIVRRISDLTANSPYHNQHTYYDHSCQKSGISPSRNNGFSDQHNPEKHRTISPMRPPPLEPLELKGFRDDTVQSARLLTTAVAEEIRILVPERQGIEDEWRLLYSLDEDGVSLGTLYEKCAPYVGRQGSFVLVIRDHDGALFGAYLSDAPHPSAHYFGNGECFLWRASMLASLPPPPSADTTHIARVVTIPISPNFLETGFSTRRSQASSTLTSSGQDASVSNPSPSIPLSPSIRFKAFPYSGENEFYMYCEAAWLSVGGGDGRYGLWLDASLEKGISSTCPTFGNEPLSDEGEKFGILGVEVWMIGKGS